MTSDQKEPLEVALARAFGEGGPLRDISIGQVKFSKLMLGICGKLERLKTHHADEIAWLKQGWEEEKKELLKEQPIGARQVEADQGGDLAVLEGLRKEVAELRGELEARAAATEESVTSIQVAAAHGARNGCPSCCAVRASIASWRSANGLGGGSENVASLYAKMDLRDRDAIFAILDLEKGSERAASLERGGGDTPPEDELTAEGLLERMTDRGGEGIKLVLPGQKGGGELETEKRGGGTEQASEFAYEGGYDSSEEDSASEPPLSEAQKVAIEQQRKLSELLDAETEALNLTLIPEGGGGM